MKSLNVKMKVVNLFAVKEGLVADSFQQVETPLQKGCISYHLRSGKHALTSYDWKCYMDFADRHGWRGYVQSHAKAED